jgi:hypothetical protein
MLAAVPPALSIVTDDADLAVEIAQIAEQLGLSLAPRVVPSPLSEALDAAGVLLLEAPSPEALVDLVRRGSTAVLGFIGPSSVDLVGLGHDLGVPVVRETRALIAAVAMRSTGAPAWGAQTRAVPRAVRARLERAGWVVDRHGGRLARMDGGLVGWQRDDERVLPLGEAPDVADAASAIRRSASGAPPGRATVEGIDREAVREVLFGPGRALSDPASKSALTPYGVPLPVEELCASPSRAASEAARIGFPVKLSLASPDLRVWDHPDLVVLGAASAAAVRDGFRTITTMAAERDPSARLLGVHVTAEAASSLGLRVSLRPIGDLWALAEIARSDDPERSTLAVLPTSPERVKSTLSRLSVSPTRGRGGIDALVDALNRVAVFAVDQRDAVTSVRIDPLSLLVGGGVELREACVVVNDLFERSLGAA